MNYSHIITDKIVIKFEGTLENELSESIETLITVKLKQPIDEFSEEGFKVRESIVKSINDEITFPVRHYYKLMEGIKKEKSIE